MSTDMLSPPIGSPSLRREIEMKRELKMEKEAARSTFQPELSARRGRDNSVKPVGGSRFDRLYNDAIKRKSDESRASIDANNYTFKPTISPKSRSVSRERKPAELFNSLHSASGAGRITVKEAPKDVKLFTPTISKRASSLDRSSSMLDVNARLYAAKKKQQENMEKEKEEAARRHAESCTFSPKLYRSRSASRTRDDDANSGPVAERLLRHGEQMKIKHQDEKALREKEALAEAPFKPTIIRRPSFSSDKSDVDVYSRLTQHTEKDKSSMIAELDVELTFQPKISKNHTLPTNETENVHERLFKEAFQKRKDVEEEVRSSA